jgi:hypothetical protein
MKKIIVFIYFAVLICISNAHAMDWKIRATDVPGQSIMAENKHTGIQKTMQSGDILDGGVIVEVKLHSVMIRDSDPVEDKNGIIVYGLREIRVSNKNPSQHLLLSPDH